MFRKALYSLLIIGAVLLAFGAITYAVFSDNIPSDDQFFTAGTVDMTVNEQDEAFETTLDMDNMEPGDCSTQEVMVRNEGTLPINLWNWIYTWHEDGASPNVFSCDPNPDCNMSVAKTLIDNPDGKEEYIPAGSYEKYELEACLPLCAGNGCQGGSGNMRMFFHAVQASNLDGWDCVKLMYKEAPLWLPDPSIPAHGNKCYQAASDDGLVDFVVNGYELSVDMPLQIMLNGTGGCSDGDKLIAGDFDMDGVVEPGDGEPWDPYYRGFYNEGGALSQTCDPSKAGEGVYAIAYGGSYGSSPDPAAITDGSGNFSGQWTADFGDPCAQGVSSLTAKFLVKQDKSPWLEELDELDFQQIEFTCP